MQESIVKQLEQRYRNDIIYTYIGDILLAINPFTTVDIYNEKVNSLCWAYMLYLSRHLSYIHVINSIALEYHS